MHRGATIAVVVPAYNEAETVADVLTTIPTYVDRVYAIDDASTDETWDEVRRVVLETAEQPARSTEPGRPAAEDPGGADETGAADGSHAGDVAKTTDGSTPNATDDDAPGPMDDGTIREADAPDPTNSMTDGGMVLPDIVPIRHDENQGAGAALKTGFEHARADEIDVTVTLDADGQMDPDDMIDLVEPVADGTAGYAKGNRLASADYRAKMPTFRLVGNWLLSALTKIASGHWNVMDSQNGYTAISREGLDALDLDRVGDDHEYVNDILVQLNVADVRVVDVAMAAEYGEEESTIALSNFVPQTSLALLRGFLWRLKERYVPRDVNPASLCYGLGAFVLAWMVLDWRENPTDGEDE